jgi:hypothetical protein
MFSSNSCGAIPIRRPLWRGRLAPRSPRRIGPAHFGLLMFFPFCFGFLPVSLFGFLSCLYSFVFSFVISVFYFGLIASIKGLEFQILFMISKNVHDFQKHC